MESNKKYESQTSMRNISFQYTSTPHFQYTQKRQLTRKQQAAKDLFVIIHTIQKRKEFRAFEMLKFRIEKFSKKQVMVQMQQYQQYRSSRDKKNNRSKSVGLYAEYSRARLLRDIVGKLKAKHQIADTMDQDDIASHARVVRLQKMLQQAYEHNSSFSRQVNESNGCIKMGQLLKQAANKRKNENQMSNKFKMEESREENKKSYDYAGQVRKQTASRQKESFKQNQSSHYDHFHNYSAGLHHEKQISNHGNYQRVRHFVSPPTIPIHGKTAPVVPSRPPIPKPYSQNPYRQTITQKTNIQSGSTYKNQQRTSYQTSGYSPRNSKGINVISQLPFKRKQGGEQGSSYLKTQSIKPASHKPESFQQRGQLNPAGNYCNRCGRYCRCLPSQ